MSQFVSQKLHSVRRGQSSVVASVVRLTAASDTVTLPSMKASSNCVVQLRRPNDPLVTVSQSNSTSVSLTGEVGDEVLLVSFHHDPIPTQR